MLCSDQENDGEQNFSPLDTGSFNWRREVVVQEENFHCEDKVARRKNPNGMEISTTPGGMFIVEEERHPMHWMGIRSMTAL